MQFRLTRRALDDLGQGLDPLTRILAIGCDELVDHSRARRARVVSLQERSHRAGRRRPEKHATLTDVSDELAAMFPWWAEVPDGDPEASQTRALVWVNGTYADIAMSVRIPPQDKFDAKELMRWAITQHSVPGFESPFEMELWLRGLLTGCAASLTWPGRQ